jgi:hypothetical protein
MYVDVPPQTLDIVLIGFETRLQVSDEVSTKQALSWNPPSSTNYNLCPQITKDLARTPGFPPLLNQIALWTIVLNPVTKFALATRPVCCEGY